MDSEQTSSYARRQLRSFYLLTPTAEKNSMPHNALMLLIRRASPLITLLTCFVTHTANAAGITSSLVDTETPQISLILSGGGTRASAFSYGALFELSKICLTTSGPKEPNTKLIHTESGCPLGQSLLERANIISAVSGGSITATYYATHSLDQFKLDFPRILKNTNLSTRLLFKPRPWSPWKFLRPPTLLLTSALDTAITILTTPLFFLPIHPEFTPTATMALTDGIFEPEQLQDVFDTEFFNHASFGTLNDDFLSPQKGNPKRLLLINATDIANGRIFTFDQQTFGCLGATEAYRTFPLSLAVAASSGLPGVFAPVKLEKHISASAPTSNETEACPIMLSDKVRPPLLVDGGVGDNLGVGAVLRTIFENQRMVGGHPTPHLLIIINAGTEMQSSLPGLSGHLDNSFDTLIRDKTDLSGIVASGLLKQFGFDTIELKLSDVVTSSLLNTLENGHSSVQTGMSGSNRGGKQQALEQAYTTSEMPRKVLTDLTNSGMTPTEEHIDTLIAAGRSAASAHISDIRSIYDILTQRKFSPVCDKINNPAVQYCWPQVFLEPHLSANRIGPFARVLAETTTKFVQQTASNREDIHNNLKGLYLEHLTRQLRINRSAEPRDKDSICDELCQAQMLGSVTVAQTMWSLEIDKLMSTYLTAHKSQRGEVTEAALQAWESTLDTIQNTIWNTGLCTNTNPPPQTNILKSVRSSISAIKVGEPTCITQTSSMTGEQLVINMLTILDSHQDRLKETPQYYIAKARFLTWLGKWEATRQTLYTGLLSFPDHEELHGSLGWILLTPQQDYNHAVEHLRRSLWIARDIPQIIERQETTPTSTDTKDVHELLIEHFLIAQNRLKMSLALALASSPSDIKDNPRYVSDTQITAWEHSHLPVLHNPPTPNQTLLTIIALDTWTPNEKSMIEEFISTCALSETPLRFKCRWLNQVTLEHSSLTDSFSKLINTLSAKHQKTSRKQHVNEIRAKIRSSLAGEMGLQRAQEYSREVYTYFKKHQKLSETSPATPSRKHRIAIPRTLAPWLQPESSALQGFISLLTNAKQFCPDRAASIELAISYFSEAKAFSNDKSTPFMIESNNRYAFFEEIARDLACPKSAN